MKPQILAILFLGAVLLCGCIDFDSCSDENKPVCGSDNATYRNICLAKKAGIELKSVGVCPEPVECADSDGGKDIFTSGAVTDKSGADQDRCLNDREVEEKFCENNASKSVTLPCPSGYGCDGARCARVSCSDSDGGSDENVSGNVIAGATNGTDGCADIETVKEYYCENGQMASKNIGCGPGRKCVSGACAEKQCEDSDNGKNTSKTGTATKSTASFTDTCYNGSAVKEYFCENGSIKNETIQCDTGYACTDGKCEQKKCSDTDKGKNTSEKGTTSYGNSTYTDNCYSSAAVLEYFCESDTSIQVEKINCGTGKECSEGKCGEAQCTRDEETLDEDDVKYSIATFDETEPLTLYVGNSVELADGRMLKLYQISGNESVVRLYNTYADFRDSDHACSTTIVEGETKTDLCDEDTGDVTVDDVNATTDSIVVILDRYYVVQRYTQEGNRTSWPPNAGCPEDTESYESYNAEFYPYIDTSSEGLGLEGRKFRIFGQLAEIDNIGSNSIRFELIGDMYNLDDGESFEYKDQEYQINLVFNDGGLSKIEVQPA